MTTVVETLKKAKFEVYQAGTTDVDDYIINLYGHSAVDHHRRKLDLTISGDTMNADDWKIMKASDYTLVADTYLDWSQMGVEKALDIIFGSGNSQKRNEYFNIYAEMYCISTGDLIKVDNKYYGVADYGWVDVTDKIQGLS